MREHYVYIHRKATDGSIFYVGKGKRKRAWEAKKRSDKWKSIAERCGFTVELAHKGLPEACSFCIEKILIFCARQNFELANMNDGGTGSSGFKMPAEAIAKISAWHKEWCKDPANIAHLKLRNTGAKRSDEGRARMSAAKKGKPGPKKSAETRAKISASHMGMRPTPETLIKLSTSHIGKSCGRDGATYDHTIRRFHHAELGEFEGTRGDFLLEYNQAASCVSQLINGKRQSVKGWRLL